MQFTIVDQHGIIVDPNARSHHDLKKKVSIAAAQHRPNSKRTSGANEKHYSHSSGNSEFGSVMNYVSSPESAYSTGYSTLHSDDCLSPAGSTCNKPEYYVNIRSGVQYSYQFEPNISKGNCLSASPSSYVDCK